MKTSTGAIVLFGLLSMMLAVACTPEGEIDLQQVTGAAETATAVSLALEQATIQAETVSADFTAQAGELASLRATVDAPIPTLTPIALPMIISELRPTGAWACLLSEGMLKD
jgi:hypothetical protein